MQPCIAVHSTYSVADTKCTLYLTLVTQKYAG